MSALFCSMNSVCADSGIFRKYNPQGLLCKNQPAHKNDCSQYCASNTSVSTEQCCTDQLYQISAALNFLYCVLMLSRFVLKSSVTKPFAAGIWSGKKIRLFLCLIKKGFLSIPPLMLISKGR